MTVAAASAPTRRRRTGWRPRGQWDVCSLGWEVLEWTYAHLPHPRDDTMPLVLTPEQARRVIRIYELDPQTGRRLFDRVHEEEAKGWGKGPLAAVLALAEFGGAPVVFDGWDAAGQPAGRPWGSPGLPAPLVQVVAVSEAQTFNVWQQVMILAGGARGDLARVITVDSGRPGRTMLRRRDIPAAEMVRATASAASRTGAPVVHAVFDEVQLWLPENGGPELANVVMFNLDKTGGWGHLLANAPVEGVGSVAETWGRPGPRALFFATRPSRVPRYDWSEEEKRAALDEVYADVPWIDVDRQLASLSLSDDDGIVPWGKVLRDKFNVRVTTGLEDAWMAAALWADRGGVVTLDARRPAHACVRVSHDHRCAAVAIAQQQAGGVALQVETFEAEDDYVSVAAIEDHLRSLRQRYPARVTAEVTFRPGGRVHHRERPGPEVLHHGAFFEPSRQRLAGDLVFLDWPSTPERLTPAAETLMQQVASGSLRHDGDAELARQMSRVVAKERPKGWAIESGTGESIVAAQAAMLAVHRAMTAPAPPSRKVTHLR